MDDNVFYVYILLDPRKKGPFQYGDYVFEYEPFYVGKGKGNRCREHYGYLKKSYGTMISNKIRKILKESGEPHLILKIMTELYEAPAFELEKFLILQIGRKDLYNGPLCNLTDGGEGSIYISEETREKKRKSMMGKNKGKKLGTWSSEARQNHMKSQKPMSAENKEKLRERMMGDKNSFYQKTHTEEQREKMRLSHLGKKHTEETKEKMRISQKRRRELKKIRLEEQS